MIFVVEPICSGMEHVPFNAGFLRIVAAAYPDAKVFFWGEASHVEYVQSELGSGLAENIEWRAISLPPRRAHLNNRFRKDRHNLNFLQLYGLGAGCRHLVLTSFNPSVLWALKTTRSFLFRRILIQCVAHGGIGKIVNWRSVKLLNLRNAMLRFSHKRLQFIVLEKNIEIKVKSMLPSLADNINLIEHPLPNLGNDIKIKKKLNTGLLKIGFLGLATESKGFTSFLKIAESVKSQVSGQVEFIVIGRFPENAPVYDLSALDAGPSIDFVSRDSYLESVSHLDFVCMPYGLHHYDFSPSGVFLDSVAFLKPVISTKYGTVQSVVDSCGPIGMLADDIEQLTGLIVDFIKRPNYSDYELWVKNLEKIMKGRSVKSAALSFRKISEG